MKKLLILYFSGVGNTKKIANRIKRLMQSDFDIVLHSIEQGSVNSNKYDAVVIGFPTYHASAPKSVVEYVNMCFHKNIPAFIYTTCGLYSANTLRDFSISISESGVYPILSRSYRCSATDGALLAPFMKCWFDDEKNLENKIVKDCRLFVKLFCENAEKSTPRFKLYSILNVPNRWLGQRFSPTIYLHKSRCSRCGACVKMCPANALIITDNSYPIWDKSMCMHCYRCIHHCKVMAFSLSKRKPINTVIIPK